jgi:hypothetical protein
VDTIGIQNFKKGPGGKTAIMKEVKGPDSYFYRISDVKFKNQFCIGNY